LDQRRAVGPQAFEVFRRQPDLPVGDQCIRQLDGPHMVAPADQAVRPVEPLPQVLFGTGRQHQAFTLHLGGLQLQHAASIAATLRFHAEQRQAAQQTGRDPLGQGGIAQPQAVQTVIDTCQCNRDAAFAAGQP